MNVCPKADQHQKTGNTGFASADTFPMNLSTAARSTRAPFLLLTPACVLLGASLVPTGFSTLHWYLLATALLGGLMAHISVNSLNEYFDFQSGLDLETVKTPFSGGSGALPQNPEAAQAVLFLGVASLALTLLIGAFFVWMHGPAILPIGVLGALLVATYTPWINRRPLICLLAPGLGFGFLMVVGTQFAITGDYRGLSWFAALVPFFLVNNLLLLNQYPDVNADARAGRNHFPIAYGIRAGNIVYGGSALLAALVILVGVAANWFPTLSLTALLPLLLTPFALYGAVKHGQDIGDFPKYLAANVAAAVTTPIILAVALLTGH